MKIQKIYESGTLTIYLEGRLDTTTAPGLEGELGQLNGVQDLIFDMKNLEYISSAGLRVLLKMQKVMNTKGAMKLVNVGENIMEVFQITGFYDILTVQSVPTNRQKESGEDYDR